jgi:hypothetical protein
MSVDHTTIVILLVALLVVVFVAWLARGDPAIIADEPEAVRLAEEAQLKQFAPAPIDTPEPEFYATVPAVTVAKQKRKRKKP